MLYLSFSFICLQFTFFLISFHFVSFAPCFTGGFTTPSHHGSLTRRCKINQRAPITGIASPVVPVQPTEHLTDPGSGSLGRSSNSLKSFRNAESPTRGSHLPPGSHSTPKHIGNGITTSLVPCFTFPEIITLLAWYPASLSMILIILL